MIALFYIDIFFIENHVKLIRNDLLDVIITAKAIQPATRRSKAAPDKTTKPSRRVECFLNKTKLK